MVVGCSNEGLCLEETYLALYECFKEGVALLNVRVGA